MAVHREKVVVAMSGGVDSSVVACLLVEQGYDVVGLFMRHGAAAPEPIPARTLHSARTPGSQANGACCSDKQLESGGVQDVDANPVRSHQGCCSASDASDARYVAGMLGIPFYALNFEDDFDQLIDYFADEYARGRTPNPCVVCNDRLKFGRLVEYADAVGARYIATGHYARTERRDDRNVLLRAVDDKKDQSYVLFGLSRKVLDRVMFPIGALTKPQVREIAARYQLPNQNKPDSVEICFVPDRDYARVVRARRPEAFGEGDVVDPEGNVLGRHKGVPNYTIGQRRGLGIAAGRPVYVTDLNVETNTVTLGDNEDLACGTLYAERVNMLVETSKSQNVEASKSQNVETSKCRNANTSKRRNEEAPPAQQFSPMPMRDAIPMLERESGLAPDGSTIASLPSAKSFRAAVKIRYLHSPAPAFVHLLSGDRVRVEFDEPQRAVTPGQAVVFYDGDLVLGGGWIER